MIKKLILMLLVLVGGVMTANAYYSLPGSWDSWTTTANKFDSNNTVTIFLAGNTQYEFKFYNSDGNSWSGIQSAATMTSDNCSSWWFNGNTNVGLKTTIAGEYTFTLSWVGNNNTTPAITVTYPTTSKYTRSVTSGYLGTICLPYSATVSGATVYKITGAKLESGVLKGIYVVPVEDLEAGYAYIFQAESSTITATLSGDATTTAIEADGMLGNLSSTPVSVPTGNYIIKDNKIRKVAAGTVTIGQYKAYITLKDIPTGAPTHSAPGLTLIDCDEEATGIEGLEIENNQDAVYNLQGQRVTNIQKGMYIINGKKVLVK